MIDSLLSRCSSGDLREPGPDEAALRLILDAAVCAPDHGKLRPWHFLIVRGDGRRRLGELFVESLLRRDPDASAAQIGKERSKPFRSPLTIVVAAKVVEGHKIPAIEQVLSAGAAAMNILNAAHQLGFGAKWVTGANCYDAVFRSQLRLEASDQVVGFIHIGCATEIPGVSRPDPMTYTREF